MIAGSRLDLEASAAIFSEAVDGRAIAAEQL
jgi:hypothetical protein